MIQRVMLHEMVVEEIKNLIKDKDYKVGDKLPSQGELVSKYGVSRTSLREGLRTLEALGVIQVINGKGMYVKNTDGIYHENDLNSIGIKEHLIYILQVRRAIDELSVDLAIDNITEEEIKQIEENLIIMEQKAEKGEPHPEYDKAFHYGIYKAGKNPILVSTVNFLLEKSDELWKNPLGAGDAFTEGTKYHRELFEMIKKKDKKKAKEALNKILDQIEVIIKNV